MLGWLAWKPMHDLPAANCPACGETCWFSIASRLRAMLAAIATIFAAIGILLWLRVSDILVWPVIALTTLSMFAWFRALLEFETRPRGEDH